MRLILGRRDDELDALIHPLRDLAEPVRPRVGMVGWWGWQRLRGAGPRSFLRWLLALGEVSYEDSVYVMHLSYEARGECHAYLGERFCFCDDSDPDNDPVQLSELLAIRRTA